LGSLREVEVDAHRHPHKVGLRGELQGVVVRRAALRRLGWRLAYQQVARGRPQQTNAFESGTSPADSNGVEALGGFSMKSGAALSIAGGSATTLFLLQISPSSVASSVSSSDTTLGAFLLAFSRGSFLRWGAGRAAAASGSAGEDWPCAAAISAIEFSELFGSPPPACGA